MEVRVARFEDDHESIVRNPAELGQIKQRMVVMRQTIENELPEERTERREKNRALVQDREREDHAPVRLTADDQRIVVGIHVPGEQTARQETSHAAEQSQARDGRAGQAHGLIHAVDRERSMDIPAFPAGIAHAFCGVKHVGGPAESAGDPVDAFVAFVHGWRDGEISGREGQPAEKRSSIPRSAEEEGSG